MNSSPNTKISAIWITKNSEKFIGYSIASLLSVVDQVIVMDAESTDNTQRIVTSFKSPKIQFSVLDQDIYNMNHSAKIGFEHATGNFVMLLGDDYVWDNNNAQKLRAAVEESEVNKTKGVRATVYNMSTDSGHYFTKYQKEYIFRRQEKDPLLCYGSFFVDRFYILHKSEARKFKNGLPSVRFASSRYTKAGLAFSHWKYLKDTKDYFIHKYILYRKDKKETIEQLRKKAELAWQTIEKQRRYLLPQIVPEVFEDYRDLFVPLGGYDILEEK